MSAPKRYTDRAQAANAMSLWSRRVRILTWFSVTFIGGYMVFFNDYSKVLEDQDAATQLRGHVFTDIQRWAREKTGLSKEGEKKL